MTRSMIRIGWFSPVSEQTGISQYSRNVLEELHRLYPRDRLDVIVFHPPTNDSVVEMPYPVVELSDSLLRSDFHALFDVAVYHLGNNDKNHGPIYGALRRHPGIVVLHDYVYQHYLAGVTVQDDFVGPSFGALVQDVAGPAAFEFLAESGVLKCDRGKVLFVPWEGQWSTMVPLGAQLARLGTAALVHSSYARGGLAADFRAPVLQLFMPRPDEPEDLLPIATQGRLHIACCGHIGGTKGLSQLVAAFAREPKLRESFRVTIAGFGSDRHYLAQLQAEIREGGLGGVFELIVDPDDDAFAAVMAAADIFYNLRHPNTEGASLSLVEQLAHHRPVIAYRTGCFAEIPEEACFFLDRVGDVDEIAALLGRIAADRSELPQRGEKAWEVVRGQTAAAYAEGFARFVEENFEPLARRAALAHARAEGRLPAPVPEDAAWLRDFAAMRVTFDEFYARRLVLPERFADSSTAQKVRFLTLNLLHARVDAAAEAAIGAVIGGMGMLDLYDLTGQLLQLSERRYGRSLLPRETEPLVLPVRNIDVWKILIQLGPEKAMALAAGALGLALPEADLTDLVRQAGKIGVAPALLDRLERFHATLLEHPDLAPVIALLEAQEAAGTALLPPLPAGADLVDLLRTTPDHAAILASGFHPAEPVGMWTADSSASFRLRVAEKAPVSELVAHVSVLVPDTEIEISVRETASGRSESLSLIHAGDSSRASVVRLALPQFSGPLEIGLVTTELHSPASLALSADTRVLGILLYDLALVSKPVRPAGPTAPPQDAAPPQEATSPQDAADQLASPA